MNKTYLIVLGIHFIVSIHANNLSACGWRRVRHCPAGSYNWHPANDRLLGTSSYGDTYDDSVCWSIPYDTNSHDQFGFATVDLTVFIIAEKNEVL